MAHDKQNGAPEEILRRQFKKLGVKEEHIARALVEPRKRDRIRSQIVRELLKKLTKQFGLFRMHSAGNQAIGHTMSLGIVTGGGGNPFGGNPHLFSRKVQCRLPADATVPTYAGPAQPTISFGRDGSAKRSIGPVALGREVEL